MCEAVNTISDVAQGKAPQNQNHNFDGPGELAAALDDFDVILSFSAFTILRHLQPSFYRNTWLWIHWHTMKCVLDHR